MVHRGAAPVVWDAACTEVLAKATNKQGRVALPHTFVSSLASSDMHHDVDRVADVDDLLSQLQGDTFAGPNQACHQGLSQAAMCASLLQ